MKRYKLAANEILGVHEIDSFPLGAVVNFDFTAFISLLPDISEGTTEYAVLSSEEIKRLEVDYTVDYL